MPDQTHEEQLKAIELQTAKMRMKIAQNEILEFEEKEENKARVAKIRVEAMRQEAAETNRRQTACKHKTGGKGKPGFLQGDGRHGYSVGHMVLPTGELYVMCIRCQKEWHHPNWLVKIEVYNTGKTTMTKARYHKLLAEYNEVLEWSHELTETAEASRFVVPLLDRIDVSKIQMAAE
jgi:hypothetical protein